MPSDPIPSPRFAGPHNRPTWGGVEMVPSLCGSQGASARAENICPQQFTEGVGPHRATVILPSSGDGDFGEYIL